MPVLNDNVGLYFYSTVFQGNMALAALTGVFVIYRLDNLSRDIRDRENWIIDFISSRIHTHLGSASIPFAFLNVDDLLAKLNDRVVGRVDKWQQWEYVVKATTLETFKAKFSERKTLQDEKKGFVLAMEQPLIMLLAISGAALMLLPFALAIHKCN